MKKWLYRQAIDLKILFKLFLPKGKAEYILFSGLLVFYLIYSLYIAFHSSIIDSTVFETDIYFSFDNPLVLKQGRTQMAGHPLMMIFYYPFVVLGDLLASFAGFKAKTVLFVLLSASLISMSCVYINRYLKEIAEVKNSAALLFTMFYAFTFTNLLLAFTAESFTLSAFFLSFNVYYFSHYIKKGEVPSLTSTAIISCLFLGGVTITNFVKGVIPTLFLNYPWKKILKRILGLGLIFAIVFVVIEIGFQVFLDKSLLGYVFVHQGRHTPMALSFESIRLYAFHHLFGTPIFISDYWLYSNMINQTDYKEWYQYLFTWLLLITVVIGLVRNYRNKFVQMIFLLLLVDISIHLLLKFGLTAPFIYGGHWIYCIPLILGWLYKSLKGKVQTAYVCFAGCLFVVMVINNLIGLSRFISIAVENFPALQ
ncbi:DUF6080 domain-containing protein [Dysgonomonas sp. 25]|uniref:DUF6080 domain-containing protein n=1 Tax=Dysgonomonas sp. 25 TaxID=2302933 RepID=UPI0013D713EE|nr:DUF6080 domain-containing protein [Dysgonomonas sp. 25]NDV68856.1 hypothetical protein [Dysgonomonas sp. 25]